MLVSKLFPVATDFYNMKKKTMEVNGCRQLFAYQHYSV